MELITLNVMILLNFCDLLTFFNYLLIYIYFFVLLWNILYAKIIYKNNTELYLEN